MIPVRVELTAELFEALGSHCPVTRNTLSPLRPFGPSSPAIDQELILAGILDSQKQVKEPFNSLLANLARTDVYLDLSWYHSGEQKNLSIYSVNTIELSNLYAPTFTSPRPSGRLILQSPFSREDLDGELHDLLETGTDSDSNLKFELTFEQVVALFTMMDLQRQIIAVQEKIKPSAVQASIENTWNASIVLRAYQGTHDSEKSLWVFSVLVKTLIPVNDLNIENIQNGMDGLVNLGLLTQSNDSEYAFSTALMNIIGHFTVFSKTFWLSVRRADDESEEFPETGEDHIGYCSQGVNLVFSALEQKRFQLRTLSGKFIADMIANEAFPSALPEWQNKTVPVTQKATVFARILEAPIPAPNPAPIPAPVPALVRETTVPPQKKKVPRRMIVGLVVILVFGCILILAGAALLIMIRMKII